MAGSEGAAARQRAAATRRTGFTALWYFAPNGTDHRTHAWQGEMIDRYIRWRNARARPERNFAVDSVIRAWTGYQTNVA